MRYAEAVRSLEQLASFQGIKPGLERISRLLELLGNPERSFQCIHIAGTNGKGTVSRMISTGLSACGLVTGEYTSPHLVSYCERFCINGAQISPSAFSRLFVQVMAKARAVEGVTEFEVLTAMALEWFKQKKVDCAVIETGLGGRYDSTNVITPLVSVITSIGFDHQAILGNTLTKIAYEKGGIIKPHVPVVVGMLPKAADKEIRRIARQLHSPVVVARKVRMQTRMRGLQQVINCGMAMSVRQVLERSLALNARKYTMGVRDAFLQGRLQVIQRKNAPIVVLDGGHNEEASMQLAQNMRRLFPRQNKLFIVGILKRKDARVVLQNILSIADTIIVTAPSSEYHSTEAMLSVIEDILSKKRETRNKKREARDKKQDRCRSKILSSEIYGCPTLKSAVTLAGSLSDKNDVICVAGSFYLIGEYLKMY